MQIAFWIFLGVILKLPVIGLCVYLWRVIQRGGEQVIGEAEGGGGGVRFDPGPRTRGPHDGPKRGWRHVRRGDVGHEDAPPAHAPEPAVSGE
ncbi:MAG: hypothetical protein WAP35_03785 [Solirubrobacterales bacterium]